MAHQTRPAMGLFETNDATPDTTRSQGVYRPVQYLGSKMRVLPLLQEIIGVGGHDAGVVWDAFTGSSVVAQAVAAAGNPVLASDMLTSSVTFAKASLGIDRCRDEREDAQMRLILDSSHLDYFPRGWKPFLEIEEQYLHSGDGIGLLQADLLLPQRWRTALLSGSVSPDLKDSFDDVQKAAENRAVSCGGLLSATYAGTYFGLRQSLRLESIRSAINELSLTEQITPWVTHVALTALCTAASKAVFSAGKHFAQPHRVRAGKDLTFHSRRVLADRGVDIDLAFETAFADVVRSSRPGGEGHQALVMETDNATVEGLRKLDVRTVYADPPYTAQQYSRFYHVLETLISAVPPKLQLVNGAVTAGLYPVARFKSSFCSRVQAPASFAHLVETSATAGARLVLSYSGNSSGTTGNARTVGMDWLVELVRQAYGAPNVSVERVNVRYKQFNHSSSEVAGRDDPEYVIVGDVNAC